MRLSTALARRAGIGSPSNYLDILDSAWQQHLAPRAVDAPTVISTFAGGGGSSLGYSMAGYRELLAVEWDDNAVATFKLNFPDVPVYHGDIAQLSVEQCLEMAGIRAGELDVFDGSPPCQGFSTAGKRLMDDPRNQLFREYVRLLQGLQPKVFVMENVSGMVKGKMKLIFADILRELKASGYTVSARLMNAMYFHVPQSRQRMIFIGVREDLGIAPSHPGPESRAIALRNICPDALASKSQKINPWIPSHLPFATIGKQRRDWRLNTQDGMRIPTLIELRQLASYPQAFQFVDADSAWERIGNSVPPLFMRSIALRIARHILAPTRAES